MNSTLKAALEYAARGWKVFPLMRNTKLPATQHGAKDATADAEAIKRAFSGAFNVGIATGHGLYVVDVDTPDFDRSRLPETLISQTPRGGWHYVYTCNEALPNTASKIAKGIDTRGTGGYIVAPPSIVDGRAYAWVNEVPPAPLPDWVADVVRRPVVVARSIPALLPVGKGYAEKALREECERVSSAQEGTRNATLNHAAFRIAQLVAGGHCDENTARDSLHSAAIAVGLTQRETEKTLDSAFRGGARHPRSPAPLVDPLGGDELYDSSVIDLQNEPAPPIAQADDADASRWVTLSRVQSLGGLCESFPAWVTRTARYQQPGIILGALMALGSALGARRFALGGATTAGYFCVIADTGDGKGHPQECVQALLREHWSATIGPVDLSSTVSTIERLLQSTERGVGLLFVLDEYGPKLKTLMDPKGYQKEMRSLLLDLATRGTGDYVAATSLARGGQDKLLRVPCMTIYGSSTPHALHDAISAMALNDGFLGRHLFFESQSRLPMRQLPGDKTPPEEVVAAVLATRSAHEDWNKSLPVLGKSDDGKPLLLYKPAPVTMTTEAQDVLERYADECDARRRDRSEDERVPAPLIARAAEHASRVSLILAVLCQPGKEALEIDDEIARVAIDVVEQSLGTLARSIERHSAESPHEQARKRVLGAIADAGRGGWVELKALLRAVPGIKASEVKDILDRLKYEETIETGETVLNGKKASMLRLRPKG